MKHFKAWHRPNKIRQNRPSVCLTQRSRCSRPGGKGRNLREGRVGAGGGSERPARPRLPPQPQLTPPFPRHSEVLAARIICWLHLTDAQIKAPVERGQPCPAPSSRPSHSQTNLAIPCRQRPLPTIPGGLSPQGPDPISQMRTLRLCPGSGIPRPKPWALSEPPGGLVACTVTCLALCPLEEKLAV